MKNIQKLFFILIVGCLLTNCTKDPSIPYAINAEIKIVAPTFSSITQTEAIVSTLITGGLNGDVIEKGICWSTKTNPSVSDQKISETTGAGQLNAKLTSLIPGTNYFTRAYFKTRFETIYSQQTQFKTVNYQLSSVLTRAVTGISLTSAIGSGSVTATGGGTITARGLCWSTSPSPTLTNTNVASGSGLGDFSGNITGLTPNTTYYLRAYATNQAGTSYGTQISFTTESVKLATLSSLSITAITKTGAFITGNVTSDGGGAITSRGICYGTNSTPTITNSVYNNNGSGIGTVFFSLTGLITGTTYYVRAYAINSAGTSYGVISSFRTL